MKFLVTGANGFVGKPLCTELQRRGHAVRAAVRAAGIAFKDIDEVPIGSVDEDTDWGCLRGVETVIHLAARVHTMHEVVASPLEIYRRVNTAGTEHLARCAAANGVKRLVYISSIKVNGDATYGDTRFTEADVPAPQDPYGVSKWEAEQALWRVARETGLEVVVVRPPLVYGSGVKGNFAQMLNIVAKGIPLPFASVHNRRDLIYVLNLIDALILCATHPAAVGQTYLVCDGEAISTPDMLRQLAAGMGRPSRLFPCPPMLLHVAGKLVGRSQQMERLLGSLQVDGDKIRADLKWMSPFSLQQGLRATAERHLTKHT